MLVENIPKYVMFVFIGKCGIKQYGKQERGTSQFLWKQWVMYEDAKILFSCQCKNIKKKIEKHMCGYNFYFLVKDENKFVTFVPLLPYITQPSGKNTQDIGLYILVYVVNSPET